MELLFIQQEEMAGVSLPCSGSDARLCGGEFHALQSTKVQVI